ncbi:hypothetical protein IIQ44_14490 [Acinetobacter oleivorans]|uniref:hypothetical protein n=1 Tax=Acinetobacter oleivorans TaxID=1148157 RepID=UPI00178C83CD|nr:hypothetical protein [Acinetobacter oleivorans]MBE2173103.1 hypothetical protein [Acinetobacter oleivorans]
MTNSINIFGPKECINHFWAHDSNGNGNTCIRCGISENDLYPTPPQFTYTVLSGAQVGSVLQLTPQIDDMGDDSNLQHHLSPFCEVRDV